MSALLIQRGKKRKGLRIVFGYDKHLFGLCICFFGTGEILPKHLRAPEQKPSFLIAVRAERRPFLKKRRQLLVFLGLLIDLLQREDRAHVLGHQLRHVLIRISRRFQIIQMQAVDFRELSVGFRLFRAALGGFDFAGRKTGYSGFLL